MPTYVSVIGTIATDPKAFQMKAESPICTFRLASNDRRLNRETNQWQDGPTNWFTINVFRSLATHAAASLAKGDRVIVHGKLRIKPWQTEERNGTSVEIDAEAVGHDLRWGTTTFTKMTGPSRGEDDPDSSPAWSAPGVNDASPAEQTHGADDRDRVLTAPPF